MRVVPTAAVRYLFRSESKQEKIFGTGFLSHFDRSAVAGSDRQRAVHHELHITRAASFIAGSRDLVRNIARGDQPLRKRNAVLGQKQNLKPAAHNRIIVDGAGKIVDEL